MSTSLSRALADLLPLIADQERNHPEAYPERSIRALFDAGIIAGPFAEHLGGRGMTLVEAVSAVEAIASVSPSVALIASMPLGLAGIYGLHDEIAEIAPERVRAAFAEQTARVAADYRAGRLYAACNSEKGAGGSLAATKTLAARQSDGGFALSGEKILASAGRNAATFFSTAKVTAEDLPGPESSSFSSSPSLGGDPLASGSPTESALARGRSSTSSVSSAIPLGCEGDSLTASRALPG